ncbi:MAG: glycosyltransferase family protein [Rhizobiales bacterium]|nr:glycosyltransferase family protein [Hyphomicrobiales bacterium]
MIVAILQARMTSTRLPGKVLKDLCGRPMIAHQLDRIRLSKRLDRIIVATSDQPSDGSIEEFCQAENVSCYRGSLNNVLDRLYQASQMFGPPDHVVRLTADCPLADWAIIDSCVDLHLTSGADYTSNAVVRTFPDGLDVEVIKTDALTTANREAATTFDREHVTPFIYNNPTIFRIEVLRQDPNLELLRWTVDTPEDFEFVEHIYRAQIAAGYAFKQQDILDFLNLAVHPVISSSVVP